MSEIFNEANKDIEGGKDNITISNLSIDPISSASLIPSASDTNASTAVFEPISEGNTLNVSSPNTSSTGQPRAGDTYQFVDGISPNVPINTWSKCDHRKFKVRTGPNYDRNKQKAPSATPLYEIFAMDCFCTDKRLDHVTSKMELPDTSDIKIANPHVPPIFVVQLQLPSDPPPLISTIEDGPGWSLVMYFKITKETVEMLANPETASAAVKLFAKWCENSDDPAWKSRFKVS